MKSEKEDEKKETKKKTSGLADFGDINFGLREINQ